MAKSGFKGVLFADRVQRGGRNRLDIIPTPLPRSLKMSMADVEEAHVLSDTMLQMVLLGEII